MLRKCNFYLNEWHHNFSDVNDVFIVGSFVGSVVDPQRGLPSPCLQDPLLNPASDMVRASIFLLPSAPALLATLIVLHCSLLLSSLFCLYPSSLLC